MAKGKNEKKGVKEDSAETSYKELYETVDAKGDLEAVQNFKKSLDDWRKFSILLKKLAHKEQGSVAEVYKQWRDVEGSTILSLGKVLTLVKPDDNSSKASSATSTPDSSSEESASGSEDTSNSESDDDSDTESDSSSEEEPNATVNSKKSTSGSDSTSESGSEAESDSDSDTTKEAKTVRKETSSEESSDSESEESSSTVSAASSTKRGQKKQTKGQKTQHLRREKLKVASTKPKSESDSSSDSEEEASSDSSSSSEPGSSPKGRRGSSSSDSEADSDSNSDSDTDSSEGSSQSSASSSSSSENEAPPAKKRKTGTDTVSIEVRAPTKTKKDPTNVGLNSENIKEETPSTIDVEMTSAPLDTFTSTQNSEKSKKAKQPRKSNTPFQRIKPETVRFEDERLKDNSFSARGGKVGDYGEKASADLIVTRGAGFRKEKNKKKRGSYRGGEITMESHSIKFD